MRAATYIDGFRYRLSKKHRAPVRFDHLLAPESAAPDP